MKILLFDDNDSVTSLLKDFLLRFEHEVKISHSGIDAKKKFEEFYPDVVLMDIHMAGLNGIKATEEIKKSYPEAIIVALSGISTYETQYKNLYEKGFNDFLQKPFDIDELIEVLNKWQNKV